MSVRDYGPRHCAGAPPAADRAILPRRRHPKPRQERHGSRPRHRQAHPHPPSREADDHQPREPRLLLRGDRALCIKQRCKPRRYRERRRSDPPLGCGFIPRLADQHPLSEGAMSEDWKGRHRREGNPSFFQAKSKLSQILASFSKARTKSSKENPWISFAESSLIKGLRRPPGPFFIFCAASRLEGGDGRRRRCPFAWVRVSFPWSSFRVRPCLFERGEGLAPFFKIADARALFVRLGGRGADEREKRTPRPRIPKP